MAFRGRLITAVLTVLSIASVAAAQTGATATLRGQVRDAQGRNVAAAHVAVTSSLTGLTREAPVDASGSFVLSDLPPGDFLIVVTAAGFAEQRYTDVNLRVGQTLDLPVALTVAGVKESVVVSGGRPAGILTRSDLLEFLAARRSQVEQP